MGQGGAWVKQGSYTDRVVFKLRHCIRRGALRQSGLADGGAERLHRGIVQNTKPERGKRSLGTLFW